jgi:hypothetical protein
VSLTLSARRAQGGAGAAGAAPDAMH